MLTKWLESSTKGVQISLAIGLIGTFSALCYYPLQWSMLWSVLLGYFLYGCLGIVVTFHRGLTHSSYIMRPTLRNLFSVLGSVGCTGSPLSWVAIHVNHHLKSDKIDDPHSPKYKGWRMFLFDYEANIDHDTKWKIRKLVADKFQQALHRYYFLIVFGWSLLLFLVGGFWLMIFGHWAPAVFTAFMSNLVNVIGHKPKWIGGFRTYQLRDESANNWLFAIPSFGEAWHNNHHRWPKRSMFSDRWYKIDIAGLIINLVRSPSPK